MNCLTVKIYREPGVELPTFGTEKSAGMDLRANNDEAICINPGERVLVPTGLYIALPDGYEAQIRPRSGIAYKHGVTVLNSPGTIDSDYRGEVKVLLINHDPVKGFVIRKGDKIAQMVVATYGSVGWDFAGSIDELETTERGAGGFESTGRN